MGQTGGTSGGAGEGTGLPAGVTVELVDTSGRLPTGDAAWLHDKVKQVAGLLGIRGVVSARVVGDEEMAEAHEDFCGVEGTTDVITFDLTDPAEGLGAKGVVEADLLLCLDEAERQAARRGHALREELLLYVVHGVLHCLGHDDHDEAGYERMHAEEDRLMGLLGIGPTFASEKRRLGGER